MTWLDIVEVVDITDANEEFNAVSGRERKQHNYFCKLKFVLPVICAACAETLAIFEVKEVARAINCN